jgi:hypothetical protein
MNLPPLYQTPSQGRLGMNFKDPRNVLYHDTDMQWDAYQFQLSSDIDFNVPLPSGPARSNNPFVQNPLAQSDPKYPSLPAITHIPYGRPNQITGSPPIRHGTLGPLA